MQFSKRQKLFYFSATLFSFSYTKEPRVHHAAERSEWEGAA